MNKVKKDYKSIKWDDFLRCWWDWASWYAFVKHSTEHPEMTFVYRVPCLSSLSSLWSHLALRHMAIFGDHMRRYRFILGAHKRCPVYLEFWNYVPMAMNQMYLEISYYVPFSIFHFHIFIFSIFSIFLIFFDIFCKIFIGERPSISAESEAFYKPPFSQGGNISCQYGPNILCAYQTFWRNMMEGAVYNAANQQNVQFK